MAYILKNVTNSIWHAFDALKADNSDVVAKSKLKVLTANMGTLMDLYSVEKGLEHYRSTATLTFKQYIYYLQKEVFSSLTDATSIETLRSLESGINDICWLVCRKKFVNRENAIFNDCSVYQLFRIFCLLAEMETDTSGSSLMVTMYSSEVEQIASLLVTSLGLHWDPNDFLGLSSAIGSFKFSTFLAVLETKYTGGRVFDADALREAIDDLYQTYVEDVIKKGYLMKKGFLLPTLRYVWFVLRPGELSYYKDSQQKDPLGVIALNTDCWADAVNTGGKPDRKFILSTPEHRCIELVAEDHRGRLQWLAALQIAIKHSGEKVGYQRNLANQRRSTRQAMKQQTEETRQELQHERQARIAAEMEANQLKALTEEECAKIQELEDMKRKLEVLLEEEKQALKDEETVRSLQARVLREEWEKREQLEKLQQEQQDLLESEKMKRLEFERKQIENERQLLEAEKRLHQLETEKETLDNELRLAREKVRRAEEAQSHLETQLVIVRGSRPIDKIRRTQSFIPTTKETPIMTDKFDDRGIKFRQNCS